MRSAIHRGQVNPFLDDSPTERRYAHREGVIGSDLSGTVEWPQVYRLSPRSISWVGVGKVLAAADRHAIVANPDAARADDGRERRHGPVARVVGAGRDRRHGGLRGGRDAPRPGGAGDLPDEPLPLHRRQGRPGGADRRRPDGGDRRSRRRAPEHWREAVAGIARRTRAVRAVFLRHSWALAAPHDHNAPPSTPISPNAWRHFEQQLAVLARAPLDMGAQLDLVKMVNDFDPPGHALRAGEMDQRRRTDPALVQAAVEFGRELLRSGRCPSSKRCRTVSIWPRSGTVSRRREVDGIRPERGGGVRIV
jgi:hypothetical protein